MFLEIQYLVQLQIMQFTRIDNVNFDIITATKNKYPQKV